MNEVSQKQLEANRQNAKLGGVKTQEGKEISRLNALRHGILGNLISKYDSDIDFEALLAELREELQPEGLVQNILVDKVAFNYLRMMRALKIEKNLIESIINPPALQKIYKDKEAGERYLQAKKEADNRLPDLVNLMNKIPEEPEYQMVVINEGEKQQFQEGQMKYLVECLSRYYTDAENRFYKVINMVWEAKKQRLTQN